MVMTRTTWRWDGWSGAPGFTNFYAQGVVTGGALDALVAAQRTLLNSGTNLIPTGVTITVQQNVVSMNESDGTINLPDTIATPGTPITGSGTGTYAAPAGLVIAWRTTKLVKRRLMMGRTFFVPIASSSFQSDGTLNDTNKNLVNAAAATYIGRVAVGSIGHAVIWHRNTKYQSDGFVGDVISASVADKVAVLTSRRSRM